MAEEEKKYFQIASLEKGIKVLELLAENQELTVTNVADQLGFNRASSHRFLATLRELGYVEKNSDSRYQLTFKVLELGMKVANRFEIRQVARPFMQELASLYNENINLGYWDGRAIVHLDKILSQEILRTDPGIGTIAPAYCTGLGKSILAFLPQEELDTYLDSTELLAFAPRTITTIEKLVTELEKTRAKGFSVDNEELSLGLRCVAAPVFDYSGYPQYALSVSGPTMRMSRKRMQQMQQDVKGVCSRLSTRLGKTGN
jgi:DNA-binding IclR family transcriptional regulator